VLQDRTGTIWYNAKAGVRRQRRNVFGALRPNQPATTPSERTYECQEGNIWVSTGIGVYKVVGDRLESPGVDVPARCMFVSRDGGLWLGTNGNGLLRFRCRVVRMFTREDGLPRDIVMAVLPSHDADCGLGAIAAVRVRRNKIYELQTRKMAMTIHVSGPSAEDG
jgi:ligand-binding sensor domain-containing protein